MGYAETDAPHVSLGYRESSMFGQVNFIPADALGRLIVPLSQRDRRLLIVAMVAFGCVTISIVAALIYVSIIKNDPQYLSSAAVTALLVTFGLAFIFVGGPIEKTRQMMRAVTQQPSAQADVNVNVGAATPSAAVTPPIARDVKEVKADVKIIGADVKDVKEQTKKDTAVAVGAVVKEIKKEVVKAVNKARKK